jgi:hypothetical protein
MHWSHSRGIDIFLLGIDCFLTKVAKEQSGRCFKRWHKKATHSHIRKSENEETGKPSAHDGQERVKAAKCRKCKRKKNGRHSWDNSFDLLVEYKEQAAWEL